MKSYDLDLEDDPDEPAKGCINGCLVVLPFWIIVLGVLSKVLLSHV
jgi:hypothetical protein